MFRKFFCFARRSEAATSGNAGRDYCPAAPTLFFIFLPVVFLDYSGRFSIYQNIGIFFVGGRQNSLKSALRGVHFFRALNLLQTLNIF